MVTNLISKSLYFPLSANTTGGKNHICGNIYHNSRKCYETKYLENFSIDAIVYFSLRFGTIYTFHSVCE